MKKSLTNAEVIKYYRILNSLKSRSDIIPGDINIYWSLNINLDILLKHIEKIESVVKEVVNANFTEENSRIITNNGQESRVFNDDVKDKMTKKLSRELNQLDNKMIELEFEAIPVDSINVMLKQNEKVLSMAEIEAMCLFIDK